jgi:phage head maturation protease
VTDVGDAARAAGMLTNPSSTERLHQYWVHGEGAAKIRWGEPNDFARCVEHLGKFIKDPQGYCNLAHHAALGIYPATHAAMEHGRAGMETARAEMTSASINDLPDSEFAYIEPGGKKDASGKTVPRSLRHFPVHDKAHVQNALSRAPQSPFGDKAMPKIKARAKKFGVDVSSDSSNGSSASRAELFRAYPLEDYHVVRTGEGDSSGRVVEAYCTVFNEPAEIRDHQGHYEEDIDPAAFNKRIADLERSRAGFAAAKVFYNHGMTIHATPSDRYSMPVAVCEGVRAESRGPITRSRYLDTPLGNEVLEMWLSGAITAQSFTGAIIRSSPELRRGEQYRPRNGQLQRVRRLELGLREFGPTPFPAYTGAELVGVRMSPPGTFSAAGHDEEFDEQEQALSPDGEAAPGEPLTPDGEHSARYHQHALYVLRAKEQREKAGLVW